ncbi:MAG: hypothetical protein KAW12_18100 [Candidatus Aminicenantes bacterium]|nr:hypothetical protein [Candidatus Aminicenantes bacterium]
MRTNLLIFISLILLFNLQCTSKCTTKPCVKKTISFKQQSPILYCGLQGFTKAETEHIIIEIKKPFEVCEIKGKINSEAGDWPEGTNVIFEIRKRDKESEINRTKTDWNGKFKIKKIENGVYCFKATVNGWQSVVGIIIVSQEADPKNEIIIEMLLGV